MSRFSRQRLDMGKLKVRYLTGAVHMDTDITVRTRRVMGISLPVIETDFRDYAPYYSPMGTMFLDRQRFTLLQRNITSVGKIFGTEDFRAASGQ